MTTRLAGGTTVSGKTIGAEIERTAPTDQTLEGKANARTAQRKAIAQQRAA